MRLKELRKSQNLSQSDLAKLLNVKQNTISNWENGRANMDSMMVQQLADYFKVTADEFLGECEAVSSRTRSSINVDVKLLSKNFTDEFKTIFPILKRIEALELENDFEIDINISTIKTKKTDEPLITLEATSLKQLPQAIDERLRELGLSDD